MLRAISFSALAFVALFALGLGLIRLHPTTSQAAYTFVRGGCEAEVARGISCWQGLRPGRTTQAEAEALLAAHPWVSDVKVDLNGAATAYVTWRWNDAAPDFLRNAPTEWGPPNLWVQRGRVIYLAIPTNLSFADIRQALGAPESGLFQVLRSGLPAASPMDRAQTLNTRHAAAYDRGQMVVETHFYCPADLRTFYDARINLSLFDSELMLFVPFDQYRLAHWLYDTPCPRPAR
jgi:hypothetical protein